MSIKKTAAVSASALAVIALASCTKEEAPSSVQPAGVTPSAPAAAPDSAPAAVPSASGSAVRTIEFEQPYAIGDKTATLKGRMVLENGIVKSVEVPGAQGPQATFAAGIADEAYGKPAKGLQIETISGASLTSAAFNEFLKTVE